MAMLVNRTPVANDELEAIRAHCANYELVIDTIQADDLDDEGRDLVASLEVEGEPADGLTLHGTRWGRAWCAFRTID